MTMTTVGEANGGASGNGSAATVDQPTARLVFVRETVQSMVAERSEVERGELAAQVGDSLGVAPATAFLALRTLEREGAIVSRGRGRRRSYLLPDAGTSQESGNGAAYRLGAAADGSAHGLSRAPFIESPSRRSRVFGGLRRRRSRWLAIALATLGTLGLVEAAVTLLWQEPFSALQTARAQTELDDELGALQAPQEERSDSHAELLRHLDRRAEALNETTEEGSALGRLRVEALDLNFVVVQGTSPQSLTKGPAHYSETPLPGLRGNWTVGVAGHRTTYDAPFRHLDNLERGDEVVLEMPYGRFIYSMQRTKIVDDQDTTIFQPRGYNRLALTACHPLYSDAQRIIAYAKLERIEVGGRTLERLRRT